MNPGLARRALSESARRVHRGRPNGRAANSARDQAERISVDRADQQFGVERVKGVDFRPARRPCWLSLSNPRAQT